VEKWRSQYLKSKLAVKMFRNTVMHVEYPVKQNLPLFTAILVNNSSVICVMECIKKSQLCLDTVLFTLETKLTYVALICKGLTDVRNIKKS